MVALHARDKSRTFIRVTFLTKGPLLLSTVLTALGWKEARSAKAGPKSTDYHPSVTSRQSTL